MPTPRNVKIKDRAGKDLYLEESSPGSSVYGKRIKYDAATGLRARGIDEQNERDLKRADQRRLGVRGARTKMGTLNPDR